MLWSLRNKPIVLFTLLSILFKRPWKSSIQQYPEILLGYRYQMSAIKNDKTEVNQGLRNIQDEAPRDISQRFSTVR